MLMTPVPMVQPWITHALDGLRTVHSDRRIVPFPTPAAPSAGFSIVVDGVVIAVQEISCSIPPAPYLRTKFDVAFETRPVGFFSASFVQFAYQCWGRPLALV